MSDTARLLVRSLTILIVDDHTLVRAAIGQILSSQQEIKRVVIAKNYPEAEKQAAHLLPDIIWLDLHIGHADGIAEIGQLRKLSAASRIMALADAEDEQQAFVAIMAGAQGYCSKQDVDPDAIMGIIQMLTREEYVLRPELLTRVMQRLRTAAMPLWGSENGSCTRTFLRKSELNWIAQLTTREREILQFVRQDIGTVILLKGYISLRRRCKNMCRIFSASLAYITVPKRRISSISKWARDRLAST